MSFPLISYKNLDTWIPSTDADEIDVPNNVLTDMQGINFRNGYIETAIAPDTTTNPTEIQDDIDAGYELLSAKGFTHSSKGNTTVYILYKYDSAHLVKIWLTGGGETSPLLLSIDEQNNDVTWQAKPNNINYNLVNDQLKINLNCNVTYNTLDKTVLANLTLVYLEGKTYLPGMPGIGRGEGWYLFPRWLGWCQDDIIAESKYSVSDFLESFNSSSPDNLNVDLLNMTSGVTHGTKICAYGDTGSQRRITIYNIDHPSTLVIKSGNFALASDPSIMISVSCGDYSDTKRVGYDAFNIGTIYPMGQSGPKMTVTIDIDSTEPAAWIDEIKILIGSDEWVVIGLFGGGQRALLSRTTDESLIKGNTNQISIDRKEIDWRVVKYEVYMTVGSGSVYYLYGYTDAEGGWALDGDVLTKDLTNQPDDKVESLNFKYGLPADTRVDNQRDIYMEVEHKGRIFFVNEDYKVYQSHISSNLAIQADSFPYDEDVGFGYFITAHNRINKGIAVTPTNYLAINTDSGFYVYYIQPSSTGSFKTLRLSSGSIGLTNRNTITRALTGDPATDGLFWVDYNGVYFYTGDSQPPKNLILGTHEIYWRDILKTDKENAVGFYNPATREYWLQIGDYLMVYELNYGKWRKFYSTANYRIDEYYGTFNNNVYWRSGNNLVRHNQQSSNRYIMTLQTPYNTGYLPSKLEQIHPAPEIYDKILQELYIVFATDNDNTIVYMEALVDDKAIITVQFNSQQKFQKFLTPLGVRFNRIQFIVYTASANKKVRIKEFGCSYTQDFNEPLGQQIVDDEPLTQEYGYGRSYGRAYGRN